MGKIYSLGRIPNLAFLTMTKVLYNVISNKGAVRDVDVYNKIERLAVGRLNKSGLSQDEKLQIKEKVVEWHLKRLLRLRNQQMMSQRGVRPSLRKAIKNAKVRLKRVKETLSE